MLINLNLYNFDVSGPKSKHIVIAPSEVWMASPLCTYRLSTAYDYLLRSDQQSYSGPFKSGLDSSIYVF